MARSSGSFGGPNANHAVAFNRSLKRRQAWAQLKRDLRSGRIPLATAMTLPEAHWRSLRELVSFAVSERIDQLVTDRERSPSGSPRLAVTLIEMAGLDPDMPVGDLSLAARMDLCLLITRSRFCIHRHRHQAAVANAGLAELARVA